MKLWLPQPVIWSMTWWNSPSSLWKIDWWSTSNRWEHVCFEFTLVLILHRFISRTLPVSSRASPRWSSYQPVATSWCIGNRNQQYFFLNRLFFEEKKLSWRKKPKKTLNFIKYRCQTKVCACRKDACFLVDHWNARRGPEVGIWYKGHDLRSFLLYNEVFFS